MPAPADLDTSKDYTIRIAGKVVGWMRADFRQAADQVMFADDENSQWVPSGRQVADYRHRPYAAVRDIWADECWEAADDDLEVTVKRR